MRGPDVAEQLLNQAEADLQAAIASDLQGAAGAGDPVDQAAPYEFQEFDNSPGEDETEFDVDAIKDVELDLCIELGRTELLIEEVLKLKEGSVVPLDKLAGDPVDIVVNGRLIARGEVLVLNDNFCVRVAEILSPEM
ncbi:MAG: flagellar motor switch protein FliN [Planctomycetes bacterium]|nr:flagellar motor switch protein FliN [Planctomycetota bacterium]